MLPLALRRQRERENLTPMERMFEQFFGPVSAEGQASMTGNYPVDIREEDDKIIVDAELPGFKAEEVDVNIDNGVLSISAERKLEETQGKSHLNERRYTRVERSFSLPCEIQESEIKARLNDGILHLELPEAEQSKPRKIE
ncbi:MAG: Hsp20/alpha crystallin family protein, partial [Phycisphaerae bacterium]